MEWQSAPLNKKPNYKLIPVTNIPMTKEGVEEFNKIYQLCLSIPNKIRRTKSGGIGKPCTPPCWDIQFTKISSEITLLAFGNMYRFQFRTPLERDGEKVMSGKNAFSRFLKLCNKWNIDIESMAIKNGKKVKEEIEAPPICFEYESYKDHTFNNVYHVDFHSSYPSGLANTHPEFRPMLESLFRKRKENQFMKAVLNYTIGFMQSSGCKYKYSHLSRDAIADNNKRVLELAKKIQDWGGIIILFNTDGFWFKAYDKYHDENEGDQLGQWHYDHMNCTFRAKSEGCYEFIEDGKYKAVVRGRTKLDEIKPREQWQWGDIYQEDCYITKYKFIENRGMVDIYEKE